jgi:hypothetical protein
MEVRGKLRFEIYYFLKFLAGCLPESKQKRMLNSPNYMKANII